MLVITDQTERKLNLISIPYRIISIVPSQTELLYTLGLDQETIAITKFCVHPSAWFRTKTRIGGTKSLDLHLIRTLEPDLIIANMEENDREQVQELRTIAPVYTSVINHLPAAFRMISDVGLMSDRVDVASKLIRDIQCQFSHLPTFTTRPKTIYLIWRDPYMTVGGDSFISAMMEVAGFDNLFAHILRYPELSIEEMIELRPEVLFLSSEPYPFKEKHLQELKQLLPGTQILLVDGELFSWYGSRLLHSPDYFMLLHRRLGMR